jgi:hypothetical protein
MQFTLWLIIVKWMLGKSSTSFFFGTVGDDHFAKSLIEVAHQEGLTLGYKVINGWLQLVTTYCI